MGRRPGLSGWAGGAITLKLAVMQRPHISTFDQMPQRLLALTSALLLGACASHSEGRRPTDYRAVSDGRISIGVPYTIRGQTYVPAADPDYDFLGYASWYGHESGNQTANGEHFVPEGISAAHRTLPLPSYVEVTALETGRTILVRVNDRGPFTTRSRIIDLSEGAARLLGSKAGGVVPVRVRLVDPPEGDKTRLRRGKAAHDRKRVEGAELQELRDRLAASRAAQN